MTGTLEVSPAIDEASLSQEFRALFESEFAFVCRALRRLGVRHADLGDVAQELFVAVHQRFADSDRSRAVRPWLYTFAIKFASNYRRLARLRPHDAIEEAPIAATDPSIVTRDLVLKALEDLNFDRRTVLVMHDMEGFDAPEIAKISAISVNTVYSRLRLAREDFRRAIERLEKEGGSQ